MSIYYLATGTAITTLAALSTFLVLFVKTTTSAIYTIENNASSGDGGNDDGNNNNNNDDDNHWWDRDNFDIKREEQATLKIALNTFMLCVACATLFVPMVKIWHPSKGVYDRFHLGVLAASAFLVGNAMFVSFWYSADFVGQQEDENGDDNNNNNDDDGNNYDDNYEMDEEELLAHHQKLVSIFSLVLALAFSALSIWIYVVAKKLPETDSSGSGSSNNGETTTTTTLYAQAKSAAHMELFNEMWKWLSTCTIAIFSILLLITCILSLGEEAERQEGGAINLIIILLWMIIVSTGILITGRNILGTNKWNGTLGMGLLSGGTMYFALLLFVIFVLYFNVEGRREEGAGLADRKSVV